MTRRRRTKLRTRVRRLGAGRRPRVTAASGAWLAIVAVCATVTVVVQSVTMIVVTLISLVVAVVSLFAGQHAHVPTRQHRALKPASARGKTVSRRSTRRAGTGPQKPKRCGARCRRSSKPASTCDCSCKGRSHGSERGRVFADTKAALKTPQARKAEKEHIKQNEGWRRG